MSQTPAISPIRTDEVPFVASALKKGLRTTVFEAKSNYDAFAVINPLINTILAKADILVARASGRCQGFVMFEDVDGIALVHVYVRSDARRDGVAKALLEAALEKIDPESSLESYFPTERWAEKAAAWGFYVPESL